ncbi:hypothetical protein SALBM135S_03486 [Streptomyces alboniger]
MLLFAVLLWCTGRRRAAGSAGAGLSVRTVWPGGGGGVHHLAGAGLGASPDANANQSLHGMLLRLGLAGPVEIGLFLALGALVAFVGLRRAVRCARDGQLLLAVAITGCVVVAVSPTTWQHQLLWVLFAVVGRVGTRRSDRYVWPVAVVLVSTLPATMMLPNIPVTEPVRDNIVLITALAAATLVPFLSRTHPQYRDPIPTDYARPVPARLSWVPLMPVWRRVLTRPNLLLELLLIRVGYSAYQQVRLAATGGTISGGRAKAEHHGEQIHSIERFLRLDIEHWVNHTAVRTGWLEEFFNFYYTSFHFVVPLSVLAVLYVRRPAEYRWARSALGFATVLALIGFWAYPLAPPRLMPGLGFIDTMARRAGLHQAQLRHADRPHQPVRGDALAALRLVAVVRPGHRDPRAALVDEGPRPAPPAAHPLRDRGDQPTTGSSTRRAAPPWSARASGSTYLLSGPRVGRPLQALEKAAPPPVSGRPRDDAAKGRTPS